jgi:hypothetical protein
MGGSPIVRNTVWRLSSLEACSDKRTICTDKRGLGYTTVSLNSLGVDQIDRPQDGRDKMMMGWKRWGIVRLGSQEGKDKVTG